MPNALSAASLLQVSLGSDLLGVGLPVLAGDSRESLFPQSVRVGGAGEFQHYQAGDWLIGSAQAREGEEPEAAALRLYRELFVAAGEYTPARIWNYVPQINAPGRHGLENYRAFCRGRSLAFENHFGRDFRTVLSAASAVGTDSGLLSVIFAATKQPAQHFENPHQVAAYNYPPEHGPRAPSFARATVVTAAKGRDVFISGTAAIRGHVSIVAEGIQGQLDCTVENLKTISSACGAGERLGAGTSATRHFKVYLRHARDQPAVAASLNRSLLQPSDHVSYLRSDVCRAELDVEIEATLLGLS